MPVSSDRAGLSNTLDCPRRYSVSWVLLKFHNGRALYNSRQDPTTEIVQLQCSTRDPTCSRYPIQKMTTPPASPDRHPQSPKALKFLSTGLMVGAIGLNLWYFQNRGPVPSWLELNDPSI